MGPFFASIPPLLLGWGEGKFNFLTKGKMVPFNHLFPTSFDTRGRMLPCFILPLGCGWRWVSFFLPCIMVVAYVLPGLFFFFVRMRILVSSFNAFSFPCSKTEWDDELLALGE